MSEPKKGTQPWWVEPESDEAQCTARTPVAWGDYRCCAPEGHTGYHGANGWSWAADMIEEEQA